MLYKKGDRVRFDFRHKRATVGFMAKHKPTGIFVEGVVDHYVTNYVYSVGYEVTIEEKIGENIIESKTTTHYGFYHETELELLGPFTN